MCISLVMILVGVGLMLFGLEVTCTITAGSTVGAGSTGGAVTIPESGFSCESGFVAGCIGFVLLIIGCLVIAGGFDVTDHPAHSATHPKAGEEPSDKF